MDYQRIYKVLFLIMAFISCFTSYSRADYNLALFAFSYLIWEFKGDPDSNNYNDKEMHTHRVRLFYLFIFSFLIDFVWLIYWGTYWNSDIMQNDWAKGVHTFVLVISIINFILKVYFK